jgi:hypothetical protein
LFDHQELLAMKRSILMMATFVLLGNGAGYLQAGPMFTSDGSGTPRTGFSGTIGVEFKVGGTLLTVTDLGVWDGPNPNGTQNDGLLSNHEIAIWNATTNVKVAGSDVTLLAGTGALVGNFRYFHLSTPITLAANTQYILGAYYSATGDSFRDQSNTAGVDTAHVLNQYAYYNGPSATFAEPNVIQSAQQEYLGPNIIYTVGAITTAPEPSTLTLLGIGILSLAGYGWTRRRAIFPS